MYQVVTLSVNYFLSKMTSLINYIMTCLAPHPTNAMQHTALICKNANRDLDKWFVREESCDQIPSLKDATDLHADQIVFSVLIPHKTLDMSRWHQFLVGVISIDVEDSDKVPRKFYI